MIIVEQEYKVEDEKGKILKNEKLWMMTKLIAGVDAGRNNLVRDTLVILNTGPKQHHHQLTASSCYKKPSRPCPWWIYNQICHFSLAVTKFSLI